MVQRHDQSNYGKKAKHIQEIGPIVEWKKVVHNTVVQLELQ